MRKRLLIIFIALIVAGLGFILIRSAPFEQKGGVKAPEVTVPPIERADPKNQSTVSPEEGKEKPVRGQIELTPEAKQSYESGTSSGDFDETMKKKRREIKITPGVIFEPGKGVSIKTPGAEENILIRRDNTYRTGEYRVQWEKKF